MLNTPFSPWPSFTNDEADAVRDVLLSNKVNYWTGGEGREFEKEFAKGCNAQYAIALANGTLALDAALMVLEIGEGDEVIVTPRTFIASISCVINAGATPVFADIDRDSGNLSAETIVKKITSRTKAVICVHLGGWICDMDPIMDLANEHGFKVIEDCAQANGALYKGRHVGSIGHIGTWSFCQDKIITTGGEGGMVTTNDEEVWRRIWAYKDHGKSYEAVYEREHPPGYRWLHDTFGTNWRMTEMQSAIGRIQIQRLPDWHDARIKNAEAILDICDQFPEIVRVPRVPIADEHAFYKCYVYVRPERLTKNWSRDKIIEEIVACGVPCYSGSCSEVYREKAFDDTEFRPSVNLPIAQELGETSLMFLVHPTLTQQEIDQTCSAIQQVFSRVELQP
ncbi:MAG: DegT/DnrJ/EryC1/StrS aminotransferase family protein [Rhizobiaceae bacterium]